MHAFTTTGVLAVFKLPFFFYVFRTVSFYEDSSILIVNIQCG